MQRDWGVAEAVEPEFLQNTVRQAVLLLRATGAAFYLRDPARGSSTLAAAHNLHPPSAETVIGRAVDARRPWVEAQPGCPAVLAMPSLWGEAVRGVLLVVDGTPGRVFGEPEIAVLQPVVDLAAAVLRQAERLRRMTAQFRALHVIDIALGASLQLDSVLRLILEKAVGLVEAEHGSLRLLNPETQELVLKAYLGEGWTPEVKAYTFKIGRGITGWVAEHRQPYLCPDAHHDPRNVVLFAEMNSSVAVPLLVAAEEGEREDLLGVLLLESARPAAFDQHDVELLEALAQEAVIAIQSAAQQQRLQLLHQTLQDEQERRVAAERWTVMGQAATALAHRINNLIGVVPASAGEIRRTLLGLQLPPQEQDWIEANLGRIERNSQFVLRLVEALFRPFQEVGPRQRFDVNRLLSEALQTANLPADLEVIREFALDLPDVESSSLLEDIFLELLTNARKAMEGRPQQRIVVRTGLEADDVGSWVVVQISDTGRGIPPEQMAHLWNMFQASTDGLGFGLWWVRTFIERQGGTIACDSTPGAGATFTLHLPAGR